MSALTATTAPCMTWGGGEGDQGDDPQGSDREGDRRPAELDSSGGHSRHDPAAPAAPQTRLGAARLRRPPGPAGPHAAAPADPRQGDRAALSAASGELR